MSVPRDPIVERHWIIVAFGVWGCDRQAETAHRRRVSVHQVDGPILSNIAADTSAAQAECPF